MDTMLKVSVEQLKKVPMLASESTCSGKTYIVTGSNTGLGLETARHLVQFGASRVILAVRNLTAGETAKKDIEKSAGRQGIVEVSMKVQYHIPAYPNHSLLNRFGTSTWHHIHLFKALPRKRQLSWTGSMGLWPTPESWSTSGN